MFASALAWRPLQAAQTAGAETWSAAWAATPVLALHTGFGHAWILRLVLVLGAALLAHRHGASAIATGGPASPAISDSRLLLALFLCTVALLLQAEMGHAAGAEQAWIRIAHGVHVLAAATWLGALLPLALSLRRLAPAIAAQALQRFSRIGSVAVSALTGSALALAWEWSGGWVGLVSTDYGRLLLGKLALLAGLLGLAALHRWRLVPMLGGERPARAQARVPALLDAHWMPKRAGINAVDALRISLTIEILLGLAALALAAGLATQPPGVHDLAVWPFAWRPDPAVFDDAGYARRLMQTGVMALVALLLLGLALLSRRMRWLALIGALGLVAAAPLPDPAVLVVAAYPSSFQHPTAGFDTDSIVLGQHVFAANCASCHGADGGGRGPIAASLPMWPPNLAGHMLWDRTDGEVSWRIGHGLRNQAGVQTMPGFADTLPEDEIWALVNFLFANAGGSSATANGGWAQPLRAPGLQAQCRDGQVLPLEDLRGKVVRVIAAGAEPIPRSDEVPALTIALVRDAAHRQDAGLATCVVADPHAWQAYALVAGRTPETFAGTELLIDRDGWLRARRVPGDARGWTSPDAPAPRKPASGAKLDSLAALIARIDLNPVTDRRAGHAH